MHKFDFGNFKFGHSTDAGKLAWLDDCDLIMHDTWFGEVKGLTGRADIRTLHSPIADRRTMPVQFQRKTLLCHLAYRAYADTRRDSPRRSASTA